MRRRGENKYALVIPEEPSTQEDADFRHLLQTGLSNFYFILNILYLGSFFDRSFGTSSPWSIFHRSLGRYEADKTDGTFPTVR